MKRFLHTFEVFSGMRMGVFLNILMVLAFIGVGIGAVLLTNQILKGHALEMARDEARLILDHNLATHTYFTHDLKPSLFEYTEPFRDEEYFDPTWMSSTYAVRHIEAYFQKLNPTSYYYKEAAINARSPENEADAYEQEFLEELNDNQEMTMRSEIREIDGERYFSVLRRGEVMEESCLRCHSDPDQAPEGLVERYGEERSFQRQEDEVVSAISIRVPLEDTYREMERLSWFISGFIALALVVLFALLNVVRARLVMDPLERIGETALLISKSSRHLGDRIKMPLFKEMRSLTEAFNTMSGALRKERDLLEKRVEERTAALEEAKEQIEYLAKHDALTGLPNRRLFEEHVTQAIKLARRNNISLTLLIADLDDFKKINDTYGHVVGDEVLREVGQRLTATLRESDMVARWGGDEFTILLYEAGQEAEVKVVMERLFHALERTVMTDVGELSVEISVGIAAYPHHGEELAALLKYADMAMYRAKEHRGNSYCCFETDSDEENKL